MSKRFYLTRDKDESNGTKGMVILWNIKPIKRKKIGAWFFPLHKKSTWFFMKVTTKRDEYPWVKWTNKEPTVVTAFVTIY